MTEVIRRSGNKYSLVATEQGGILIRQGQLLEGNPGVGGAKGDPGDGVFGAGDYSSTASYAKGAIVHYALDQGGDGSGYLAVADVAPGQTPASSASWMLLVDRGAKGADGADAVNNPPPVSSNWNWRRKWASGKTYAVNDVVYDSKDGASYILAVDGESSSVHPSDDPTHWDPITKAGDRGQRGYSVQVRRVTGGVELYDADGTIAKLNDGGDGTDGTNGHDGHDGKDAPSFWPLQFDSDGTAQLVAGAAITLTGVTSEVGGGANSGTRTFKKNGSTLSNFPAQPATLAVDDVLSVTVSGADGQVCFSVKIQ